MNINSQKLPTQVQGCKSKQYKAPQLLQVGEVVKTTLGARFNDTADLRQWYY